MGKGLKEKRLLFNNDVNGLKRMMHGFGDAREPLPETMELLDNMIQEYISEMTLAAQSQTGNVRGGNRPLTIKDIVVLIKDDEKKYGRVVELLALNQIIAKTRKDTSRQIDSVADA